jgi:hypothetical protein
MASTGIRSASHSRRFCFTTHLTNHPPAEYRTAQYSSTKEQSIYRKTGHCQCNPTLSCPKLPVPITKTSKTDCQNFHDSRSKIFTTVIPKFSRQASKNRNQTKTAATEQAVQKHQLSHTPHTTTSECERQWRAREENKRTAEARSEKKEKLT